MSTANGSAVGPPLSPQTSYSASKSAMAAIFGPDHRYSKESEQKQQSKVEPPSGFKGKGTADNPYDQGNAPEKVAATAQTAAKAGEEPLSGVQGKGTADEPYDQGNASETTAANQPINTTSTGTSTPTTTTKAPAAPSPASKPAPASQPQPQPQSQPNGNAIESRGRTLAPPANTSRQDRSVSPGTLDDGTHKLCGGETGGGYEPQRGLGRLANKVFGSNK